MTFVALDFETTGTDPKTDRIIQVGAVRLLGGEVTDRFHSLVSFKGNVPIRVRRLTGIDPEHLLTAPSAHEVMGKLIDFIGDDFVAAHNAAFEKSFLEAEAARLNLVIPRITYIDTVELARLACPEFSVHRLDSLANALSVSLPKHHDALSDAETCGLLYTCLVERLKNLGRETLELIVSVSDDDWPLRDHIMSVLASSQKKTFRPGARDLSLIQPLKPNEEGPEPVDTFELAASLKPGGPIASVFTNYEYRQEQIQMMALVADAFNDGKHLLAEAGTGTGKSMAYLLPAARWALQNSEHVLISTHTINLQEQLLRNDIPLLTKALGWDLRVSLLKGRSNYLCLRRLNDLLAHGVLSLAPHEKRSLARLLAWVAITQTGDRGEISLYGPAETLWDHTSAKTGACALNRCPYRERCFVNCARKRAAASHIVIVNHSLVFSDIASNNKVLPSYSRVIFDEAHHLEDSAALHLGVDLSLMELMTLLSEWSGHGVAASRIQRSATSADDKAELLDLLGKCTENAQSATRRLYEMGDELSVFISQTHQERAGRFCQRLYSHTIQGSTWQPVRVSADNLSVVLKALARELSGFTAYAADESMPGEVLDVAQQASSAALAVLEATSAIEGVLCSDDENSVRWLEANPERLPGSITLRSAPVDVSGLLRDRVFEPLDSVIMTSATLSVEGSFDYVKNRLGLTLVDKDRLIEEIIGSPFDYISQALLCIPTDMPPVQKTSSSEISERLVRFLNSLVSGIGGRTLVLFTSHRLLQDVYYNLKPQCEANDICLLAQGIDGTRTRLIEELRSSDRTVVFGSNSFWEGVDVPGNSLSCVVMVRLPFWPPNMPVIEARQEKIEKAGQSAFSSLSLPEAVIRFKQGFGRLIRTRTDKGCVVVIDQRIAPSGSKYGRRFLNSLPGPAIFHGTSQEIIDKVSDWVGVQKT